MSSQVSREIIDISLPISPQLLVWPGDPPIRVEPQSRIAEGDSSNVSHLELGSHTGTHFDAPLHFVDGSTPIDAVPLDACVGPAVVVEIDGEAPLIGAEQLEGLVPEGSERVLLKTSNSKMWASLPIDFPQKYAALSESGARWLVDNGVRFVGVDFLSVETRGAPGHPTHVALLEAGIVILEGANLSGVQPGEYFLVALPLKIEGCDGAPGRAILIKGSL